MVHRPFHNNEPIKIYAAVVITFVKLKISFLSTASIYVYLIAVKLPPNFIFLNKYINKFIFYFWWSREGF